MKNNLVCNLCEYEVVPETSKTTDEAEADEMNEKKVNIY